MARAARLAQQGAFSWFLLLLSSPPHLVLLPLVLLALSLLAFSYSLKASARRHSGKKLPPGSLGLPLIGETLQFAFCNSCAIGCPPPFLSSRLRKYGSMFKTHLFGWPSVISMDPDFNSFLLTNEEKLVRVNFPNFVEKVLGPTLELHGKRHQRFREIAASIGTPTALQSLHLIPIQEHVCTFLYPWSNMIVLDVQQESQKFFFTYSVKVLCSLAPEDPKTALLMSDFLPLLSFHSAIPVDIPGTTYHRMLKARKRIDTTFKELIQARRNVQEEESKDFIDVLMKEKDEYGNPFSEEDIIEFLFTVVLASINTTSSLLTNIMKFLSENALVVDELQKEHMAIRRCKRKNEFLTWNEFKQMHFTKLVFKETLRIVNVVDFVVRDTAQDITFKDMVIPKGWKLYLSFAMVHLNPHHYNDPLKFNPWRWKDVETMKTGLFMPFGGGKRLCVGSFLAEFEVSMFIHYLVTSYKWQRVMDLGEQQDVVSIHSLPSIKNGLLIKVETI